MKQTAAKIHTGLAWFIFVGANVQFVLIALAFFGGAGLQLHTAFGAILMLTALLLLIAALVIRHSIGNVVISLIVLLALVPIQGLLVRLDLPPALRSLHAANGLLIMWLSYALARGRFRATISKREQMVTHPRTQTGFPEAVSASRNRPQTLSGAGDR